MSTPPLPKPTIKTPTLTRKQILRHPDSTQYRNKYIEYATKGVTYFLRLRGVIEVYLEDCQYLETDVHRIVVASLDDPAYRHDDKRCQTIVDSQGERCLQINALPIDKLDNDGVTELCYYITDKMLNNIVKHIEHQFRGGYPWDKRKVFDLEKLPHREQDDKTCTNIQWVKQWLTIANQQVMEHFKSIPPRPVGETEHA